MKERPIIFGTEMVKAILEGRKTQTRRVIKLNLGFGKELPNPSVDDDTFKANMAKMPELCPYGQVGDRLWVRETFCKECYDKDGVEDVCYREDCERHASKLACGEKWKPSIFMPRWASRILLEITGVRVERLQEITGEDAKKEGISLMAGLIKNNFTKDELLDMYRGRFSSLWDSLNAKRGYGWDINPWVWVIEFKVLEA